jgi:uncharacterized protein YndB with AHSA1/START domain
MPTTTRTRTVESSADDVWRIVGDAHHLARWWPRVKRVEGVTASGWTKVFVTEKGRSVRADYAVIAAEPPWSIAWAQELEDSPFERLMDEAVTKVTLASEGESRTKVTIALQQKLRGWARFAPFLVKRGTRKLLDEALDGLEQCTET